MSNDRFGHEYADVNDIRMHYVTCGQGKLIMFLHGFPEFWAAWENQLAEFGKDHQAVAPDLRGFNLSSKPSEPGKYHIKTLVEDIRALMDHLGHERMVLVAHDWGGGVAWAFAKRYPGRLDRLVIVNSPNPGVFARELLKNPGQQEASGYMNMFRRPDAEQVLSENNYAFLIDAMSGWGGRWQLEGDLLKRYVDAWSQPGALTGGLNYYRISPLHPATTPEETEVLRQVANVPREAFAVRVPTLVLWGEQDKALLTGNLDGLDDYVDDLVIERIAEASHWVVHEYPDLINSRIRAFIEKG